MSFVRNLALSRSTNEFITSPARRLMPFLAEGERTSPSSAWTWAISVSLLWAEENYCAISGVSRRFILVNATRNGLTKNQRSSLMCRNHHKTRYFEKVFFHEMGLFSLRCERNKEESTLINLVSHARPLVYVLPYSGLMRNIYFAMKWWHLNCQKENCAPHIYALLSHIRYYYNNVFSFIKLNIYTISVANKVHPDTDNWRLCSVF